MVVELKYPSEYVFSSALDEIIFTTSAEPANFCLKMGDTVILDENYVPDSTGRVVIYDLQKLIEPYLLSNLIESFTYTISDGDDTQISRTFTVQFCTAESSLSARTFMDSYFLTTLMGEKITASGRKEFLHLVTSEVCTVLADCTYWADGILSVSTVSVKEVSELNKVVTVEVSPSVFEVLDKQLVKYEIKAGQRTQLYKVDDTCFDVAPSLLFTNSFGCQETFYCTGTQELEPQFARSASIVGGMYRNCFIEENRIFSANTGVLNIPMSMWADDLFRSREIYLLIDNLPDKQITIMESDSKRSNDYEVMYVYTFKYRYAQRNHNILHLPKAGRVFDFSLIIYLNDEAKSNTHK